MLRFYPVYKLFRRLFPNLLKRWLRTFRWFRVVDEIAWDLPGSLSGYRMTGPGVFGAYVEKPYESLVAQAIIHLVQPGWVCVDVGAHLGYFTLLMVHLAREKGRVFAFEAHPENFRWLQENMALNGLTVRVTVENLAVSDGSQTFVYLNAPTYYTTEWSIVRASPVHRSLKVRAVALDQYFAQGPRVNFIKMDIEGAEYLAFLGMRHLLQRDRPVCLIELHGEEGQMAVQFLLESEYTLMDLEGRTVAGPMFPSHILAWPG